MERMAPTVPYKINDKYYMIVGYATPRDLVKPVIHTGFYLYPTSYGKVVETYDHLSTRPRPGFIYEKANTPDRDDVGNICKPIAGIPNIPPDRVWIAYYAAAGNDTLERQELKKEFVEVELPRVTETYLLDELAGEEVEVITGEGEARFQQQDGLNVWFGVLEMDVKYTNPVGDTRPAPGSGR